MSTNRYMRLITIDLSILAFCLGAAMLGFGFWASMAFHQFSGTPLLWIILLNSFLSFSGLLLILLSVKLIVRARKEYDEIINRK
ncbi:MAG: hypothetical protein OK457_02110 [Thaumarchaeota archaeon]|nr:hypothetical protein [Nitrososphaerota archaeon]